MKKFEVENYSDLRGVYRTTEADEKNLASVVMDALKRPLKTGVYKECLAAELARVLSLVSQGETVVEGFLKGKSFEYGTQTGGCLVAKIRVTTLS